MRAYHWLIIMFLYGLFTAHGQQNGSQSDYLPNFRNASFQASLTGSTDSVRISERTVPQYGKSPGKAFLLSFMLPGAGEYYLGDRKMGAIFFGTEIALWSAYFFLNWYSDLKADDYTLYAAAHAGVDPHGKDHDYYVNIESHETIAAYNDAVLQDRRPRDMYPEGESYDWSWDSKASMRRFERMRLNSDRFKNAGLFMIGGVVLNHLVSGIDAIRIARKADRSAQNRVHLHFAGLPGGGMKISLWKTF